MNHQLAAIYNWQILTNSSKESLRDYDKYSTGLLEAFTASVALKDLKIQPTEHLEHVYIRLELVWQILTLR